MCRILRCLLFATWATCLWQPLNAQEEWTKLEEVPQRVPEIKDSDGFTWQLTNAGSFYSSGSNSFKSANQLTVNGERFSAAEGRRTADGNRYEFKRQYEKYTVIRDVWMDLERSVVRYYDIFINKTEAPVELKLTLESDFSYNWENLHSSTGKIVGMEIGPRDTGVYVKFDPQDGQSDVFFLVHGERSDIRAKLETDENNREVAFHYTLTLPPKGRSGICHWIGQRAITTVAQIKQVYMPIYQRRHLVRPRLPELAPAVKLANFQVHDATAPAPKPFDADALIGLNQLLDSLQVERTGNDLLWVSEVNQLGGEVYTAGDLRFESKVGELTLPLDQLAALRGGGGNGGLHEVFTRDGEVFSGEVFMEESSMRGPDGWQMSLDAFSLDTLLFRVEEEDGKLGENVWAFAELDTGDILALDGSQETEIPFSTPWGVLQVKLGEVEEMAPVPLPTPRHRLQLSDGCKMTGFLVQKEPIEVKGPRIGQVTLDPAEVALSGFWQIGNYQVTQDWDEDFETEWLDAETSQALIWLEGGNRLAASLEPKQQIHLVAGKAVTPIAPEDIALLRRTEEGILDRLPLFELELKNGDLLTGQIRERAVALQVRGASWQVPTLHLLGYRQGDAP